MIRIVYIDPDEQSVAYRNFKQLDLDVMQSLVRGMIEFVYHESKWLFDDFVVNEEGMINQLRPWALGPHVYFGPAFMVTHHVDSDGESTYSDAQVKIDHLWDLIDWSVKLQ